MEALQHYREQGELQPLFSHLDELSRRVDNSHARFGGNTVSSANNTEPSATSVGRELESLPLPSLVDAEGSWTFPCFEGAHDWEALQAEVNECSKHFSLPAAKVAWKKWALRPANVQVVVAIAWWVVAHVYRPFSPGSADLQARVMQALSTCYAHSVVVCRRDNYTHLWLEAVAAAAVRLLREAFPSQQHKLGADLLHLVRSQLLRWTSGLLPSDLHPSPEATHTSGSLECQEGKRQQPSSPHKGPPPLSLQPAAITLYQRYLEAQHAQQELEHASELPSASPSPSRVPSTHQMTRAASPPRSPSNTGPHHLQQATDPTLTNMASGAACPPSARWLSACMDQRQEGLSTTSQPIASQASQAGTGRSSPHTLSLTTPRPKLASASAAQHTGSEAAVDAGSPGLRAISAETGTYYLGPTAQRQRSRRPAVGLLPQKGQYHSHYQPRRRHQHAAPVSGTAGVGSEGLMLLHAPASCQPHQLQDAGAVQTTVAQGPVLPRLVMPAHAQVAREVPTGVYGGCGDDGSGDLRQPLHGGGGQGDGGCSVAGSPHWSESEPSSPPLALNVRKGFMTNQLSPAMAVLMTSEASEQCGDEDAMMSGQPHVVPTPPLLSSGKRHEKLGATQPSLRQPLHRGAGTHHTAASQLERSQHAASRPGRLRSGTRHTSAKSIDRGAGLEGEEMEAMQHGEPSYAKQAALDSTQRAADAVARYEAHKKVSRREVAAIQRDWKAQRDGLTEATSLSEASNQVLADRLSGWVEGWGDAGRIMKGKPPATTRAFSQQAPSKAGSGPRGRALPATSTDAVLWSKGGASVGAAVGVRSKGTPVGGGSSAANPPSYTRMTEAAVAGVRQAGTSILAACAATQRSAPSSTTRIMQPWSRMRAVQARARSALSPSRHSAADVAAHVEAVEQKQRQAGEEASRRARGAGTVRGTLDVQVHKQARKCMHGIDMGMYET